MSIDCFFYLTIAIVGFLSELEDTDPLVLERDTLPGSGTNYALIIAVLLNITSVVVAFPLCYFPFRQAFFKQVYG